MALAARVTLAELRAAADRAPDAAARLALGDAHAQRREPEAAVEAYETAIRLDPASVRARIGLARVLAQMGCDDEAIDAFSGGLSRAPGLNPDVALELGAAYERVGDVARAIDVYARTIGRAPHHRGTWSSLFAALLDGRTSEEAEAHVATLIAADDRTDPVVRRMALARGLERHGRYPEAVERWLRLLGEMPDDAAVLAAAAGALVVVGDRERAALLYARGLRGDAASGDLLAGELNLRWRTGDLDAIRARVRAPAGSGAGGAPLAACLFGRAYDGPVWDGAHSLEGRTVLVTCFNGGLGDHLLLARFAPRLTARGARVIVEVPPQLVPIVASMRGVAGVVAPYDACEPFDCECRAEAIALLCDWTAGDWNGAGSNLLSSNGPCSNGDDWPGRANGTRGAYLAADAAIRKAWTSRLDPRRFNIGIAWRSGAVRTRDTYTFRSAPLALFEPLARLPGVTLHGLQAGLGAVEASPATRAWLHANHAVSLVETAAAIEALDAIVTVDSCLAHLAGALGARTFMLLPFHPDWRWMTDAPASLDQANVWYPSGRAVIQASPGDWSSALAKIASELAAIVAVERADPGVT